MEGKKLKGIIVIGLLIALLGFMDAAWIIYHRSTITTNIIGEKSMYNISQEFANTLSLNTSSGITNVTSLMEIEGITGNINMSFDIQTRKTDLTNASCPNYDDDCCVIVTHIHNTNRNILSNCPSNIGDKENFTFLTPGTNYLEYMIECVEDSCSQRINSNITLEERR
ncbi:MAG: hypothetical protein Q7S06_02335 [Nanoarchaeota archaeon]|nr:hypothetical protein [Nanoarchaeota archaeon]